MLIFFFFKQKTAYEMRISDWSSDVCSSDLQAVPFVQAQRLGGNAEPGCGLRRIEKLGGVSHASPVVCHRPPVLWAWPQGPGQAGFSDHLSERKRSQYRGPHRALPLGKEKIGRAPCRDRVCQDV